MICDRLDGVARDGGKPGANRIDGTSRDASVGPKGQRGEFVRSVAIHGCDVASRQHRLRASGKEAATDRGLQPAGVVKVFRLRRRRERQHPNRNQKAPNVAALGERSRAEIQAEIARHVVTILEVTAACVK